MQNVAEIAPIGNGPGLLAFRCSGCGATDSVLVYPLAREIISERMRLTWI
jgi:hypothetical protein